MEQQNHNVSHGQKIVMAAAFSSYRREGLGGQDGGDAGCPEEDGGGRDMDAC